MSRFRLYCGLAKDGQFFQYTEVKPLIGGALAMLDGIDKSGGARLHNLVKGSIGSVFTAADGGVEYKLKDEDYLELRVADTWKIGYEQIKLTTGEEFPIIPENFFCIRCSKPGIEHYTEVSESWQKLVDGGFIDEFYIDDESGFTYEVELPEPIVVEGKRTMAGGTFTTIIRQHIKLGDMMKVHKNAEAMSNDSAMICAVWDASIVGVKGMNDRDFNVLKRMPGASFSKTYIAVSKDNIDAMNEAEAKNIVGMDASPRKISCKYCGEEIGGSFDFTNFFSPLLPKKFARNGQNSVLK